MKCLISLWSILVWSIPPASLSSEELIRRPPLCFLSNPPQPALLQIWLLSSLCPPELSCFCQRRRGLCVLHKLAGQVTLKAGKRYRPLFLRYSTLMFLHCCTCFSLMIISFNILVRKSSSLYFSLLFSFLLTGPSGHCDILLERLKELKQKLRVVSEVKPLWSWVWGCSWSLSGRKTNKKVLWKSHFFFLKNAYFEKKYSC